MRILIALMLTLAFSCTQKAEKLEIEHETLVKVLADVHISEGALLSVRPAEKDSFRILYYNQIYDIHQISGADFEHDMDVLKRDPKLMERIYEKVMETLEAMEKEINKKEPKKEK